MRKAVVIGGGISGLSLTWFLRTLAPRIPTSIQLLEGSDSLGGWIKSSIKGNFLFEDGPRGFRPSRNGAEILKLVEELQLQDDMLVSSTRANARYVLHEGCVNKVPSTAAEFLRWPLALEVIKSVVQEVIRSPSKESDESVYEFTARRFSPTIARSLVDPIASGIFGGDIRYLSVRSCFPILRDMEQKDGSIVRSILKRTQSAEENTTLLDGSQKSPFVLKNEKALSVSFKNGMGSLIDALSSKLENDENVIISTKARVQSIRKIESLDLFELVTTDEDGNGEKVIRANDVFAMIPGNHLFRILESPSLDVMDALKSIKFVSMGVVHLGFNADIIRSEGFGYLVPSQEREKVLGVVYDSVAFPSQNRTPMQTRLSVMAGGAHCPWITNIDESDLEAIAFDALERHLNISQRPDFVRSLILKDCIPQYHVGFWKTLETITTGLARTHSGLRIGGNSFFGVGIADCVSHSKKLALEYAQLLDDGKHV